MKLAALEYMFMFDATNTWQHSYQFEQDLSDFFAAHGYEANVVKTVEGSGGRRILYVRRIQPLIAPIKNPPGRPASTGTMLNKFRDGKESAKERDFKKGSLVKTKGYLKK